ncbi:hypothetical protein HRU45_04180 [Candidatus Dependentiae bacterium]|nr:hypothetical protein [Candidatus Dependentiae bacterium]
MKHIPSDKYTVAWFKLADVISRGEKERALGVYRLLSHSLDDTAFATQLEGDILLAFKDHTAITKYEDAAWRYHKEGRVLQAAAVYEHLLLIGPETEKYITTLINWYESLNLSLREQEMKYRLFDLFVDGQKYDDASELLSTVKKDESIPQKEINARRRLILAMVSTCTSLDRKVLDHIKIILDWYVARNEGSILQAFLSELEALNEEYYLLSCQYIDEGKNQE